MPDLDWIRKLCLSLPDATEDMPWADNLCFKVRGKIFTGAPLSEGRFPRVTLKCDPAAFNEMLEIEGIVPAPYVGRYKWIQISSSNLLAAGELEALIRKSYELVTPAAPKKKSVKASKKSAPNKKKNKKK